MSYTKAQARTKALQFADAVGSSRWDATANGEVDQAIAVSTDQEWRTILDANPYYQVEQIDLVTASGGRWNKSSLDTGAGDTAHRHYKVIGIVSNNLPIKIVERASDYINAVTSGSQPNLAYDFGAYFQLLPSTNGVTGTFYFNYLPASQTSLAGEGSTFIFPDGFEDVPLLMAAAYLLTSKAGAQAADAAPLVGLAQNRRNDMLLALSRPTLAPKSMRYSDSSGEWGV